MNPGDGSKSNPRPAPRVKVLIFKKGGTLRDGPNT